MLLVAGPLTWDHYLTWALLPFTLLCDVTRWQRLRTADRALLAAKSGGRDRTATASPDALEAV